VPFTREEGQRSWREKLSQGEKLGQRRGGGGTVAWLPKQKNAAKQSKGGVKQVLPATGIEGRGHKETRKRVWLWVPKKLKGGKKKSGGILSDNASASPTKNGGGNIRRQSGKNEGGKAQFKCIWSEKKQEKKKVKVVQKERPDST